MAGVRAIQKEKTRRALVNAAFNQLSAEKSFSNLSLREVAREAGIAPTSFYRHFSDMDELGLEMVDEAGLILRQLMRQARKRIDAGGSVISVSVDTFLNLLPTAQMFSAYYYEKARVPPKHFELQPHEKSNILSMNSQSIFHLSISILNILHMFKLKAL